MRKQQRENDGGDRCQHCQIKRWWPGNTDGVHVPHSVSESADHMTYFTESVRRSVNHLTYTYPTVSGGQLIT